MPTKKDRRTGDEPAGAQHPTHALPPGSTLKVRTAGSASKAAKAARLRELKQQIADGTYKPDPHAIAREIMKRGL